MLRGAGPLAFSPEQTLTHQQQVLEGSLPLLLLR